MVQKEILLKEMNKNNVIISNKEVLKFGIHKDVLKKLTEKKEIIKIANGLYGLPNEEIDEYIYFSHRVPKGIFSHETAAYLQGLSTRMPLIYVMTVPVGDNVSRIKSIKDNIIFKYSKKDYYDIDKERTILDLIKNKNRIDTNVFSEAMKLYFRDNDRDLLKISKYAIYMNMEEQLKQYTEVLL